MVQSILVGSALFGLLVVGVVAYLAGHEWRHYSPILAGRDGESTLQRLLRHPGVWTATFVVAVVGLGLSVVAVVSGDITGDVRQTAGLFLAVGTAAGLTLYLFFGTFVSARSRGLARSQAAALGSWVVGLLLVVAIVFRLLGTF
jgi:hypothetical protein